MSILLKVYMISLVNIPLFTYLCESFFSGKDKNENLTPSFGIFLIVIYSFQSLIIILLNKEKFNIKKAYLLLALLLILAFVGILNSNSVIYSIIVFLQYFNVFLFCIWLAKQPVHLLKFLIVNGYFASLVGFVTFAVLHYFISNGDFLFTLAQIQLPAYFILFLFSYRILNVDRMNKVFFYASALSYLFILFVGGLRAIELQQYRLQFLPIALFLITVVLLFPKILRNVISIFLFIYVIFNDNDFVELLLYRLGSFEERLSIIHVMALDSFYFLVPQGLGASNKLFDINSLTQYSESTRSLYPPHSGFAAMLFDSSIIFFVFVFIFLYNILKDIKVEKSNIKYSIYFYKTRIPFLIISIFVYVFENIFYLKFSITGATFSDDSLFLLLIILFFYYKARTRILIR